MYKVKCILVLLAISSSCIIVLADIVTVSPFNNFHKGTPNELILDSACLKCLCDDYLGTGCDEKQLCYKDKDNKINGVKLRNCDLLGISYTQWSEEKHFVDSDNETSIDGYINCKRNPICSAQVVNGYVAKIIEICNRSSITMSCLDYLLIHNFGDKECKTFELPPLRKERFDNCISRKEGANSKPIDTNKQRRSPKMESFKNP